jgi:Tfp pilus assembly pilus retraction ATPase PilT
VPKKDGTGRIVAMEILNNNYACANLIRTGKIEQLYSQLQTRTKDKRKTGQGRPARSKKMG